MRPPKPGDLGSETGLTPVADYGFDTDGLISLFPSFMSLSGMTVSAGLPLHGYSVVASVIASISVAVVVTRAPQGV